jgi:hypothetical protein
VTWGKTFDKINVTILDQMDNSSNNTEINGKYLTLKDLSLSDQQYYGCFNSDSNETESNSFEFIDAYYLIVRGKIIKKKRKIDFFFFCHFEKSFFDDI